MLVLIGHDDLEIAIFILLSEGSHASPSSLSSAAVHRTSKLEG